MLPPMFCTLNGTSPAGRDGSTNGLLPKPLEPGSGSRDADYAADAWAQVHLGDARGCYRVEGAVAGHLVGDPEGARGAEGNAPGVLEAAVDDLGLTREVGNQVRLQVRGLV